MANPTIIRLQDGNVMPQLGLGVWKASNEEVIAAIHKALEVGYRSIDTATAYQNEEGVGKALKAASVAREELFITTKLWNDDQKRPREALQESLKKLQLDYLDLYLMHWPVPAIDHYVDAWKGMIALQKEGLVKSIGVCNFQIHHLQRLIDETGVTPVINQLGFTSWFGNLIGDSIGSTMHGTSWIIILLLLNAAYFYTHYFFASGNAQIAALYAVFLGVGLHLNIPAAPMALMLAFTSSLYCSLTQYTHARGPILFGAGYVPTGVWWRTGFIISLFNQAVFLTVGLAWWKVLGLY